MTASMQTQSSSISVEYVTPAEATKLCQQGHVLFDVRSAAEFRKMHASNANCVELTQLKKQPEVLSEFMGANDPVIFTCHFGKRAMDAAQFSTNHLSGQIYVVQGGTEAWAEAGLPITTGEGAISLERQVRIAAGILVATGTLLGIFFSPWYLAIPLFIGSGLAFAGITDTCGMALMLSRMPWNR